jgi:hypothetical protein
MDSGRTYVYAIVAGEVEIDLGQNGMPDGSGPVTGLRAGGFTAVVSPYAGPPMERLPRADVLRGLIVHQRVIERVMGDYSVLPARFGTVLGSAEEVRQVLITFRPRLERAFEDISGAVEIDLSATWDLSVIFGEIRHEPALADLADVAGTDIGDAGLAMRIQAGELVQVALERRREEYRHRAVEALAPLVRDMRRNPLPADDIVLNLALLVDRHRLAEVDVTVDRLASEWDGRVTFRYVGPLPPYSFATVILGTVDPDQVASALQMLELPPQASRAELRAAYRRRAADLHPDRSPRDPAAAERFAALGAAYRLLTHYLEGQRTGDEPEDAATVYDLTPERVGHAALLEIVGDDSPAGIHPEARHGSAVAAR